MSEAPLWVTVDEVIDLNRHVIAKSPIPGEPFGIVDQSALESAVARPLQHFSYGPEDTYDDLVLLGVKLCVGISESQAFRQGNKRTGFAAMEMFFNHNSYEISDAAVGQVASLILASADPDHSSRLSDEDFAEDLDRYIVDLKDDAITAGGLVGQGKLEALTVALGAVTYTEVTEVINVLPKWTQFGPSPEDEL